MIAIIDYGAGNTASVANAVKDITTDVVITADISLLKDADKIILPGVGEASAAMENLKRSGTAEFLKDTNKSVLGICLGMQLLGISSEEGSADCLGLIDYHTVRFRGEHIRIPHMGWTRISFFEESLLFKGLKQNEFLYFAHSYYVPGCVYTTAESVHGGVFSAAVQKENYFGVQFHPEKSGETGLTIIRNFIELC